MWFGWARGQIYLVLHRYIYISLSARRVNKKRKQIVIDFIPGRMLHTENAESFIALLSNASEHWYSTTARIKRKAHLYHLFVKDFSIQLSSPAAPSKLKQIIIRREWVKFLVSISVMKTSQISLCLADSRCSDVIYLGDFTFGDHMNLCLDFSVLPWPVYISTLIFIE